MSSSLIPVKSEYERLLEEVKKLQARLAELTALRDDLLYHVCPALRALYDEKIASLERELLAARMYLREKQRIIEILQAQLNRKKKLSFEKAEEQARTEYREYEEELKRKAEEAKKFRDFWENQTDWSKHDKAGSREKTNPQENAGSEKNEASHQETEERDHDQNDSGQKDRSTGEEAWRKAEKTGRTGLDDESQYDGDQESEKEGSSPAAELKSLYRKIVKRLHPDVIAEPTGREKELLLQANEAYKTGNLEKMRQIWEELTGMDPAEEEFEDTEEGRAKLRERIAFLKARCMKLEQEIRKIRSEFPYTMKSFLEDEAAVEERRGELQEMIRKVREMDQKLAESIENLKRQMGKS